MPFLRPFLQNRGLTARRRLCHLPQLTLQSTGAPSSLSVLSLPFSDPGDPPLDSLHHV